MALSARLPGIQFDVASAPVLEALVRMDIAAFAGFAASGPLNLPIAIEAISDFEEIFGSDLTLAQDESGNPLYAYLAPAVRAFFRNGGRRCWVVRLAGKTAVANRFQIPGLAVLHGGALLPAFTWARSEGSWSDGLAVSAALRSQAVQVTSFVPGSGAVGLALTGPDQVSVGDLLKLSSPDGTVHWLFVDTVTPVSPGPNKTGGLVVAAGTISYTQASPSPRPLGGGLPVCELLVMDLFAQDDEANSWNLTQLGFSPKHPRYWASLPTDLALYEMDAPDGLAAETIHPRFPLAGTPGAQYFLPFGIGPLPTALIPATIPQGTELERNGLAVLNASLFLDPALAGTGMSDLLAEADYIRYQSGTPRALLGIHSLLGIDEATVICVPDVVQRGWMASDQTPLASPPAAEPLPHPEWWHFLDCHKPQAIPLVPRPPAGQFEPVDLKIISPPSLAHTPVEGGRFTLTWAPAIGAIDFLEEAIDPAFASRTVLYQGSSGSLTIYGRSPGDYYYRLRRMIGQTSSDYSAAIAIRISEDANWKILPVAGYQGQMLLDVQVALLRMSAARGDLFAVLAMPQHFGPRQALEYSAELVSSGIEAAALSFGALYHPWLSAREENSWSVVRTNPPDGAIAGVFAKRSSERGAWIAPANEALKGVVALDPPIPSSYYQQFQDSFLNLVRQEPGGFLCLCSSTMSSDDDLSPINVRRLLSFLRKTALREGAAYVFEPNSNDFRRAVQRGFEKVLERLFLRGAFAGRNSSQGFQVVTDGPLNTPQAMDQGQFFVELRVAPSLPMRFLTVRLLQTGDRTFVTEGN